MSEVKWTPAQQYAIEHRGSSLLVSAAAGSGKTAVLVERVVSLLTDPEKPVQADRLLIVTFTNAAAAELRTRIARRLGKAIAEDPQNIQIRRQRVLLQRAAICTIDSFCLSLLQKNFSQLDIPPDFTTADEAQLFRLRQQTLTAVLEKAYEDPDFCAFADLYGRGRSDAAMGQVLLDLYDFLRSLPYPRRVLETFCCGMETDEPLAETIWAQALAWDGEQLALTMVEMAGEARQISEGSQVAAEKYGPVLAQDRYELEQLHRDILRLKQGEHEAWHTVCMRLESWEWKKMPSIRGGKDQAAQQAAELRDEYKGILKKLKEDIFICTAEEFEEDRRRAAPLVRALARAVIAFEEAFFAAKKEEKILEFSDFEHLSLQLLCGEDGTPTQAAALIASEFDAVMVDEYQDTNALQDALYRALSGARENRFLVGDLKQSIYRFRQADPTIFLKKLDTWPEVGAAPGGKDGDEGVSLALDANFRSAPAVVDGVNFFFRQLMSRNLGDVEYGPGQALVAGAAMPEKDEGEPFIGSCETMFVEGDGPAPDVQAIVDKIRTMAADGVLVRDGNSLRPCQWGDFCILLRSRGSFAVYSEALEAAGIPVHADVNENLLDAPQVRPLIALLQVLDNPAQDVALAAVMLSPFGGFSVDDMVALRAGSKYGSLYGALLRSEQENMQAFVGELNALRRLGRTLSVSELLEEIMVRSGYLAAVGAMNGGARRQEGLRSFMDWAGRAGQGGLSALIRNIDAAMQTGGIESGGGAPTQAGCVTIMTVHRSKGLEFPIVLVADTAHRFNLMDLTRPVLFHRLLGLGMTLRAPGGAAVYPTLMHRAVKRQLQRESASEEMRVLYVALTRAKDHLILSVPTGSLKEDMAAAGIYCGSEYSRSYALQKAGCWSSWLLMAALRHPDAEDLRRQAGVFLQPAKAEGKMRFTATIKTPREAEAEQRPTLPTAQPDEELVEKLRRSFSWQDERRVLRSVPAKVTVTAVVHGRESVSLQRPAFLYKDGLTGAEKGTAMHAFLQSADLQAAAADLEREVQRQTKLKLMAPELADRLDRKALQAFFASGVYRRLCAAKEVLREYAFISSFPARWAMEDKTRDYGGTKTLVQGVVDLVLVFEDHAEIVDYKTDRRVTPEQLLERYAAQLRLYRFAMEKRLPCPVTRCTIYSLSMGAEVDVPLGNGEQTLL